MANAVYPAFKDACINDAIDLSSATVKCCLVSTTTGGGSDDYTYSSAHDFFNDVPAGSIVAAGVALSNKAFSNGAMTADPVVFTAVADPGGGQIGEALIFYIDTGTDATSRLIGYMDTATGLPVTPNGDDITVNFSGNVLTLA